MKNAYVKYNVFVVFIIFLAVVSLPLTGCAKKDTQEELIILCGTSFVTPTKQLCAEFTAQTGWATAMTVGGSEDFLPQVKTGKIGDVLVTHDPFLDYVRAAGALADHAQVGLVAPVLAVQKGNPRKLTCLEDLAQPGLRVALSDPKYSTCGEMVLKLLEKKGIKDAVLKNVENRLTKGHPKLCTFLKTQVVDAVITWNGVAYTFKNDLEVVPTPYEYDTEILVHVIGLSYSHQTEALGKFMEFARSRGPEIFAEHGYVK